MSRQDDRSDAALRERLELAEKAVPKGEKTIWTADFAEAEMYCGLRYLHLEDCF